MTIVVSSTVLDALVGEAVSAFPREACGLLFGSGEAITGWRPAANVHSTPNTHFEIDPQALIDAYRAARNGGPRLVGYYHSHPTGPPRPSATDQSLADADGMVWAIVGEGRVTLWRAGHDGLTPLPIHVTGA